MKVRNDSDFKKLQLMLACCLEKNVLQCSCHSTSDLRVSIASLRLPCTVLSSVLAQWDCPRQVLEFRQVLELLQLGGTGLVCTYCA
jgi:hypothetical protein